MTDDDHEALPSVRRFIRGQAEAVVPQEGDIRLLAQSEGEVQFAVGNTSANFSSLTFEQRGSEWRFVNSSSRCLPQGWVGGVEASPWSVNGTLDRNSRQLQVLVDESGCASGATADGRIAPPLIDWEQTVATITITVRPEDGPQTCQSNPPTAFSFDLPEPLGSRKLLDGFHEPPAPPGTPMAEA